MGVTIITDSTSEVSQELAAKWNIIVKPLQVRFGEEEYTDGITLSTNDFYKKLVAYEGLPKTSAVAPFSYEESFRKALDKGDDIVCLCISSAMSSCYQSACVAREETGEAERIHVIDTRQTSAPLYCLVSYAVRLRNQGNNAAEIAAEIEAKKSIVKVITYVHTLKYLHEGGRISTSAAVVGKLLNIKPVLTVRDGEMVMIGRARGTKTAHKMIREYTAKHGIDFTLPVCLAYADENNLVMRKYIYDNRDLYGGKEKCYGVSVISATIGTYSGPGALAVAFFPLYQ